MIPAMQTTEDTYSASQAAKVLKLDARTVRKMCEREELEATRDVSGYWRISQASAHAKLEELRQEAVEATEEEYQDGREATQRVRDLETEVRDLSYRLGRSEARVELTEKTESTMQDERSRLIEDLERERARAEKLERELRESRRSWWSRMFGGGEARRAD